MLPFTKTTAAKFDLIVPKSLYVELPWNCVPIFSWPIYSGPSIARIPPDCVLPPKREGSRCPLDMRGDLVGPGAGLVARSARDLFVRSRKL